MIQEGTSRRNFTARDVTVKGFGKKVQGMIILDNHCLPLCIGVLFLSGATITFSEDGNWKLVFPAHA